VTPAVVRRDQALAYWFLLQACCLMRRGAQQVWPAVLLERSAAALRNLLKSAVPLAERSVAAARSPPEALTAQSAAAR
jgi:hypothetical protein